MAIPISAMEVDESGKEIQKTPPNAHLIEINNSDDKNSKLDHKEKPSAKTEKDFSHLFDKKIVATEPKKVEKEKNIEPAKPKEPIKPKETVEVNLNPAKEIEKPAKKYKTSKRTRQEDREEVFINESKSKYSKNEEPPVSEITTKNSDDVIKNLPGVEVLVGDWIKPLNSKISEIQNIVGAKLIKYEVEDRRCALTKCKDESLDCKEKVRRKMKYYNICKRRQ